MTREIIFIIFELIRLKRAAKIVKENRDNIEEEEIKKREDIVVIN